MLRTRLWMGALLIALSLGVLAVDQELAPWYPFLLVVILALSLAACHELLNLVSAFDRLPAGLCFTAVGALLLTNWLTQAISLPGSPWSWIAVVFAGSILAAFLQEMANFREPGGVVIRLALVVWAIAYLGLLPCFLAQLRWLPNLAGATGVNRGTLAVALAIFVPKCGDIGAYFTGRLLGRHRMVPLLSPKKTWEGAVGHILAATLAAVAINALGPALPNVWLAAAFGVTVGLAGMFGDLAESLVKRDCSTKDASDVMPGFGGVLDVVDSIVFAAPVAYVWFVLF